MSDSRSTFSSLRHRNFRLYFFTQLISNSGNWLTNVALTLLVLKLVGTGVSVGLLVACQYGPIFFLTAWGGAISDRVDKRKGLLLTQTLEMSQSCALAILAFMHHPALNAIYLVALCGGVLLAFDNPLRRSFVSEMVGPDDIPNAVIMYSAIVNFSRVVGPLIAGLLAQTVGYGWCFTVDAISYAFVIAGIAAMRPADLFRTPSSKSSKGAIREGIRYIAGQRALLITFAILTIIGIFSYNFTVTFPLFTKDALHRSPHIFTEIYAIYGLGSIASVWLAAKRQLVKLRDIVLGSFALGVSILFLGLSRTLWLALIAAFLVGVSSMLVTTAATTFIQVEADSALRGRVLSLQMVVVVGSVPIGGPLLGWVADHHGGRAPLIIGGIAALVAGILGKFLNRSAKQD